MLSSVKNIAMAIPDIDKARATGSEQEVEGRERTRIARSQHRPMRCLVVSPAFPPVSDAESICAGKFVQALIDSGVDTQVIFASDSRLPAHFDPSSMWDQVKQVSFDIPGGASNIPRWKSPWLMLRYQSTSWVRWTRSIVLKARELDAQRPFDLVISRSLPRQGQLAGYWVASTLGVPWIAVVNDPWDLSPFAPESAQRAWKPGLDARIWWRRMLAKADRICFPSERLRDHCLRGWHRENHAMVVPHIGAACQPRMSENTFRIVHSGKLGVNELTARPTAGLLEGVKELLRTRPAARLRARIVLVGPEDPQTMQLTNSLGLAPYVSCTGLVGYEASLEHIARASICVLVEGEFEEGVFLPSKLCDYISARKPVIALSPSIGCVADLAAGGGIKRVGTKDAGAIAATLVEMFDAFEEKRLDSYMPPDALVNRFEPRRVIGEFLGAAAALAKGRGRAAGL
jgi:glycosyltransferase involved in cell wall biosynthesis